MNSIFLIIGIIFSVVGVICGVAMGIPAYTTGESFLGWMALLFFVVFFGIGITFIIVYVKGKQKLKEILECGVKYWGTIVEYADDYSLYINGIPGLDLKVLYNNNGTEQIIRIQTKQTREDLYPLGATCQISILNGQALVVPGSVQF